MNANALLHDCQSLMQQNRFFYPHEELLVHSWQNLSMGHTWYETIAFFAHPLDMKRFEFVAELADLFHQLTQHDCEIAVATILDAMSHTMARGHRIEIRGFGAFSINHRPSRIGRNPHNGGVTTPLPFARPQGKQP